MEKIIDARWFQNAVAYHILIDRFAGLNRADWQTPDFMGGNLKGVIDKLDYLEKLGVNTLWLSPFYKTSAYHGYHITDFFSIDPRFGTIEDLQNLINETHGRGMKIIADFVPNHCSRQHLFFQQALKDKHNRYYKWFVFKNWPCDYLCFLDVKELPKLNLDAAEPRNHIVQAAGRWLSLGLDGFRLDHVPGPSHAFWKHFRKSIKKDFPAAVLIGEAWAWGVSRKHFKTLGIRNKWLRWLWGISQESIQKEYISELDGVLDFKFRDIVLKFLAHASGPVDMKKLGAKIDRHFARYPKGFFLPTFLDNHDANRFLFECGESIERLRAAVELQFKTPQPVIIYYGTEAGMTQQRSISDFAEHGDLQARAPMHWAGVQGKLFEFYRKQIAARKDRQPTFAGI